MIWNKTDAATVAQARLRIGYKRSEAGTWTGVLRRGRTVVLECGHWHHNRDQTTRRDTAALDCIRYLVQAARNPATADYHATNIEHGWKRLTNGPFTVPASTIATARAEAQSHAAKYRNRVAALTQLLTPPAPQPRQDAS